MLHAPLTEGNLAGAFFCLDPESEEILLMRALDASSLTTQNLESDMERFVNALDFWSSKTKNGVFSFEAPHNLGEKREDPSVNGSEHRSGQGRRPDLKIVLKKAGAPSPSTPISLDRVRPMVQAVQKIRSRVFREGGSCSGNSRQGARAYPSRQEHGSRYSSPARISRPRKTEILSVPRL